MTVTAAAALTAQLESYGVEYVFGTCGHTNIALLDAIGRSQITFVIARHEQAAAHAADGYARATGKPGVLLVHVGPGMMNAVTGVATAAMDSVPLVAISGDVPGYYEGRHPHQEVNLHADADQTAIYRPFTKRAWHVRRAQDLPRFAERAFWTATSGRPGAVLLNVPMDIFSRPLPDGLAASYPLPAETARPGLEAGVAARIAGALAAAERPLIYIGGGLRTAGARTALLTMAEHLDIPIAHSLMAKGTVPDGHPLVLGMPGFWGLDVTNAYARDADLVLALGTRFAETDASSWHPGYTWRFPPSRLIQVDIDPAEIGRNFPVEIGAVADTALAVTAIAEAVARIRSGKISRDGLRAMITDARTTAFAVARAQGAGDDYPLRPQRILADLRAELPPDAVLVTDVGWNKNGVAQCYELPEQGRFITPGGASTMGFGPAAAIGVQIGYPERIVVALIGDGGMSAQLPAIPMAVERGLPVLFVVMNNRAHGTIADLQAGSFGATYGCEFTDPAGNPYSPDFAALAVACGADGYPVRAPGDLRAALRDAVARRRPAVIDVPMINEPVPTPGHWNITDIYRGVFETPTTPDPLVRRLSAMSPRPRYRIGSALAAAAVVLAAAACSAPGASSNPGSGSGAGASSGPIKIAVVDAQSGAESDLGQFEWRGVSLAVNQANAAGGIGGRKINLTLYDDQGDPTVGTELAKKIASQGEIAMFGTAESAVTLAMAPILASEHIPNITSGQSTQLVALNSPYLFLNGPTGLTYDTTLANYLVKTKGYKKIAMLTNNDSYGAGEQSGFSKALKSLGITPVAGKVVPADQTNMTPALTAIHSANPQVLFIGAEEAQSGLTVKQARALGMTSVIAEGAPAGTPLYMSTAGAAVANGTIVSSPYLGNDTSPAAAKFAAAYTAAYGSAPELHGAKAYDGAEIVIAAMKACHACTGLALASAIRAVHYAGLLGNFDYNGSGVGIFATAIGVITDGKIKPVS